MPTPVMSLEQFMEGVFPLRGIDISSEIAEQRPGTTRTGVNVRGQEMLTLRSRGGSRPGTDKFIVDQVSGDNFVQCLEIIVDPTTDALLPESDTFSGDVVDSSTSNLRRRQPTSGLRRIRRRGSGAWFSRNTPKTKLTITADDQTKTSGTLFTFAGDEYSATGLIAGDTIDSVAMSSPGAPAAATTDGSPYPIAIGRVTGTSASSTAFAKKYKIKRIQGTMTVSPGSITFIQSGTTEASPGSSAAVTFTVTAGDLLLVAVSANTAVGAGTHGVTDSQGNTYTQVGTTVWEANASASLSLWRAFANASGSNTMTGTWSIGGNGVVQAAEYSNVNPTTPVDTVVTNHTHATTWTTTSVAVGADSECVFGVFTQWFDNIEAVNLTAGAPATLRERYNNQTTGATIGIFDINPRSTAVAVTCSSAVPDLYYCAIGVSLKPL